MTDIKGFGEKRDKCHLARGRHLFIMGDRNRAKRNDSMNKEQDKKITAGSILAITSLAIFYFVFLGGEYLFDNMIGYHVSSAKVVLAQGCILGSSGIGFFGYSWIERHAGVRNRGLLLITGAAFSVAGIFTVEQHVSFAVTMTAGLILFLLLGFFGSSIHYLAAQLLADSERLAGHVGMAYALGILFQFLNNNLVKVELVEAILLSLFLVVLAGILSQKKEGETEAGGQAGTKQTEESEQSVQANAKHLEESEQPEQSSTANIPQPKDPEDPKEPKTPKRAALLLVILVALMTCIFATLDNAVTLVHAAGKADIGQWPRLLLACSGLAAGAIFDLGRRKYMSITMYCVMLLSTVCVVMIQFGGPFLAGLIVFYLSAGFFAVYFTTGFLALSLEMKRPVLWAGMGRGINNSCALITGAFSVFLLDTGNNLLIMTLSLVLFAVISVVLYLYLEQYRTPEIISELSTEAVPGCGQEPLQEEELLAKFCKDFLLTKREGEVLAAILHSEESAQKIAEELNLSRAALYRHISSINEKTGTGSRIGLLQFYFAWEKEVSRR